MNTNKFLTGGVIAGVLYYGVGYGVWGVLLMNFMKEHTTEAGRALMRKDANGEDTMIMWALIAANLLLGFLLSYVLSKAGTNSASSGASTGAVVGLLFSATVNFFNYAFMDMSDFTGMGVDIVASTIVSAIVGAVIGWYFGRGKK